MLLMMEQGIDHLSSAFLVQPPVTCAGKAAEGCESILTRARESQNILTGRDLPGSSSPSPGTAQTPQQCQPVPGSVVQAKGSQCPAQGAALSWLKCPWAAPGCQEPGPEGANPALTISTAHCWDFLFPQEGAGVGCGHRLCSLDLRQLCRSER